MFSCKNGHQLLRGIICSTTIRNIQTTSMLQDVNYYESLGIPKASTQNEIKAAYYRLSMIYHPDKNQGSDSAAKKFREISQAYEVLSNYRLRRLYDKGIIHTAGAHYAQQPPSDVIYDVEPEDDPQTKFYKSRFKKSEVSDREGRNPIYNFDEWSRAHYGKSFDRSQEAKRKYERKQSQRVEHSQSWQKDIVVLCFIFGCAIVYFTFAAESAHDTPRELYRNQNEQKNEAPKTI